MKQKTINQRLLAYYLILFFLSTAIAVYINVGTGKALKIYNNFTNQYSELNAFYKDVAVLDGYAQMYLYTSDEEYLDLYRYTLNQCCEDISELKKSALNEELIWNYTKLQNMVDTYSEVFEEIGIRRQNFQEKYGFYSRIAENIQNTYIEYSTLIADEMNAAKDQMNMQLKNQIGTTVIFVLAMMASALLFAYFSARNITLPIRKIVSSIEKIKKEDYNLNLPEKVDTVEVAVLKEAVQEMADEVQASIRHVQEKSQLENQLLEKENENLKVKELLIETELKVLQGQMNPHFLFNTLSLISKMAYLEGAEKTSELMETTTDLLRYSLDKSNSVSDLYSEIESVKNYIKIQEVRFGHRIKFELSVGNHIPKVIMPGMIIQPLIENAVIHGVKNMVSGAHVLVSVKRGGDKVYILVEDNGTGMDSSRLEAVQSGVEEKSIGINNVRKRLELFFGIKPVLSIESAVQCGTAVTVELPVSNGMEEIYEQSDDSGR
ncbi:HAMP domain-containing protein [Clostridium sp. MCC353]|uniref:sensor histidine kinase n=1 Tax=Clostridium sp. MCC353 TaxID=2592646 RepID=UPI001C02A358|nr:HAMP domain-containing protein [Clostridium sp. MCC353]